MVLFDGAAASEESDDEHDNAHKDQHNRPGRVELLVRQVHVRRRVDLSLDAHDQDYQARDLWMKIVGYFFEVWYTGWGNILWHWGFFVVSDFWKKIHYAFKMSFVKKK